jgi:hypothetical protein
MKNKVKIICDTYSSGNLETQINEWLENHQNIAIVNIKYSTSQCGNSGGSVYRTYSVLIHYTED